MNTKIKICGLFRNEDIEYVNEALPDFAGFIFYPKSHRYVSAERAAELIEKLDCRIKSVGVFVNESPIEIAETVHIAGLDIVQLHGEEDNGVISEIKRLCPDICEVWKAVRIKDRFDTCMLDNISFADKYLADAYVEGYGGQGRSFDPNLVREVEMQKLITAGGLSADNMHAVIKLLSPYAVDLSSGVETNKVKDRTKILKAVKAVREYSKN